ncbi:hypothetical protein DNHGIG_14830 [Collibacillus ludicampi]|uniref:Uncharacterized protein n=1 Tax=Collibacillus ludicampi TaxID=2771369 RepID=A0AAV4LE49_9BACL|nr:hypothetical protein [Collibacillus ludicampi]GIM45934.1 hypothetical protein DNHGIG_14830 [Collibacillus ludicampi]
MGAVVSTLTPQKSLQLKLIIAFSMLQCGRTMQLDIIEYALGERKNITDLSADESRRVLNELMGGEVEIDEPTEAV